MNKSFLRFLALSLLVWTGSLSAQSGSKTKWHNYDPATETTVSGKVVEVTQHPGRGAGTGTHLLIETDGGRMEVHLGPTNFVASQNVSFAKGDAITVTGSKMRFGDSDVIIAREVKKGDSVLTLRDRQGIPKWSRGRQGQS